MSSSRPRCVHLNPGGRSLSPVLPSGYPLRLPQATKGSAQTSIRAPSLLSLRRKRCRLPFSSLYSRGADTTGWKGVTFQAHIKDSVVTSDVSGRQVTPIPDTHRLELPPSPLTPSWANTGFTPLALFRPQHFSLSEGPFPSSLSLSHSQGLKTEFSHITYTLSNFSSFP